MQIRAATPADADAVVALWRATPDVLPTSTDDVRSVEALLKRDGDSLLLAERDGRLVGTLIVGWDGWRGNVYRLAVASDARREGVATSLLAHAEAQLRAAGCQRIAAWVDGGEDHATAFWAAAGYQRTEDMRRFVKMQSP
jgi:ribosomal protein S18 acetylase RimI-like enzyme